MTLEDLKKIIDESDYWDSRVKSVECNYFADEIQLTYYNEKRNFISYRFTGCYRSVFDHVKNYDKAIAVKDMILSQIPYFIQEIGIDEKIDNCNHFWICKINMFPLYIEIWCKDIDIKKDLSEI